MAFFCPGNRRFDDTYLDAPAGLGGAESALVQLSRALVRQGAEVHVFCDCPSPGAKQSGVVYRHVDTDDEFASESWDLFTLFRVGVRREFWAGLTNTKRKAFWSCDQYTDISLPWPTNVFPFVDEIICISPYHRDFMTSYWGALEEKTTYTDLGVHWPDYAEMSFDAKEPNSLIYCSVPDRGLAPLATIFPLIRERVPDATLYITADYTLWGSPTPQNERFLGIFHGMDGVRFVGKLPRLELVKLQKRCQIHAFPLCMYTEMPEALPPARTGGELFCLASLECQAAGTPTITTPIGSMPSTVDHGSSGYLVDIENDPLFIQEFADVVVDLLRRPKTLRKMGEYARGRAQRFYDYDHLARQWIRRARMT